MDERAGKSLKGAIKVIKSTLFRQIRRLMAEKRHKKNEICPQKLCIKNKIDESPAPPGKFPALKYVFY
jgi:hypothetical protein